MARVTHADSPTEPTRLSRPSEPITLPAGSSPRRANTAVILALAVGAAAIALNLLLARQLVQIGNDARALAETWISRSSTLATFEDGLRDFRQREARFALSVPGSERDAHARVLDSLTARNDSALGVLLKLDDPVGDSAATRGTLLLQSWWREYQAQFVESRALPGGESSAALQAFRSREVRFQSLTTATRRAQESLRAGADRLALRNRRSTRTSSGLLGASLLLTLFAGALAELVRRSRRARAAAEQRWQDVADQSVGIVWELGPSGRVRFCSRSGAELLGEDPARITNRRAAHFVFAGDQRNAIEQMRDAARAGAPLRDLEVRVVRRDGAMRWLAISGQPLLTERGASDGFRGLAVDITRRAQAEQALAQSRRMEAVGTLAGGVAHDLNNVLTAVTGYAQLVQVELPRDHQAQSDLAAITSAADRGAALVRRVLQFARQRPTERQAVELSDLVHEVVQLLRPQLPPHVRVNLELPETESLVLADPTELHQVVVNIAANALHAMKDHGSTLGLRVGSQHDMVMLIVRDDGVGMSSDVLDRAMEPFFSTRDVGDGTGMGLSVAHGVVTALGGGLQLESVAGQGTTVTVTLPRARFTQETSAPSFAAELAGGPSLRVILIDDDIHVRQSVSRVLEMAGHDVTTYESARTALSDLHEDPSRADVIVTDLTMPVMNGLEFTAAMQGMPTAPPIIMCSGYLDRATSDQAKSLGIVALLDKPVGTSALLNALQSAVAARNA
jgi:PAS domain S-box-containing protein